MLGFLMFMYWAYYTYALTRLRGAKNIADVATVGAAKAAADRSDRTLSGAGQLVSADSCVRLAPQGTPAELGTGRDRRRGLGLVEARMPGVYVRRECGQVVDVRPVSKSFPTPQGCGKTGRRPQRCPHTAPTLALRANLNLNLNLATPSPISQPKKQFDDC